MQPPRRLTLKQWEARHAQLRLEGLPERSYGGPLARHVEAEGDRRLRSLLFDDSPAALQLWNFLLTENSRLREARRDGFKLVGTMKDLGTVPVLAYSLPGLKAFYPDGSWWTPCLMEGSDRLFRAADRLGIDDSFCPVRALIGAFESGAHFPLPDQLFCSSGAVCDDFSAIAQRLESLGHPIIWWEIPRRRIPDPDEPSCELPGGLQAPTSQVTLVRRELERIAGELSQLAGTPLTDQRLRQGIAKANTVRSLLNRLRECVYSAIAAPFPALEMLIAEMLAIHFCSDLDECLHVLGDLLQEAQLRSEHHLSAVPPGAVRVFWVNPVADLRAMNLVEEWGGRVCGSDYMFTHALDALDEALPPWEALARAALADPMVGPSSQRAERIIRDCRRFRAEALVVSRIPGASHCAHEGMTIQERVQEQLGIPTIELEIPSICDAMSSSLRARLEALFEIARERRLS